MLRSLVVRVTIAVLACAAPAASQTTLRASSTVVAPGTAVTLTVTGPAGQHFAVAGSSVGAGLSFGGVSLPIGVDVQVITTGVIGGTGSVAIGFVPPFTGTTLDRFYLVAVTSPSPTFIPPSVSPGVLLRNADAVGGPAGGDLAGAYPNPTIASSAGGAIVTAINATGGTINEANLSTAMATKSYVDAAIGGAVGVGAAAGGDLVGNYPNPQLATTANTGATVVAAINASPGIINAGNLSTTMATRSYVDTAVAGRVAVGASAGGDLVGTYPNPQIAATANTGVNIAAALTASPAVISANNISTAMATRSYVDTAVAGVLAVGASAGGDLVGTYPNPQIASTVTTGTNIVAAINASPGVVNANNISTTMAPKSYVDAAVAGSVAVGASAGGDLFGTYPNPQIAPAANTGNSIIAAINASAGVISATNISTAMATRSYVDTSVAGRVAVGASAGGDLFGSYPNPQIAPSANTGNSIIAAINASAGVISATNISPVIAPRSYVDLQTATRVAFAQAGDQDINSANALVRVRQLGSGDLLSLRVNSSSVPGHTGLVSREAFRVLPDGGFVAQGVVAEGFPVGGVIPATGAGTRFMWYPRKAAVRFGKATGAEWDDPGIGDFSFAGGSEVTASGFGAFAHGEFVTATGRVAVGFGSGVTASGIASFSVGSQNRATNFASMALGYTTFSAGLAAVAVGYRTAACGDYSVALGLRAVTASADPATTACAGTAHSGSFVWSDASGSNYFRSTADNQFNVRAAGGVRIFTNNALSTGVSLDPDDGTWNTVSDRNVKTNFRVLDGEQVLVKLARMPIVEWSYIPNVAVRHVGPMAQDFHEAFGLGSDPLKISTIDPSGIALRAIQALEERTRKLQEENQALRAELDVIKALLKNK